MSQRALMKLASISWWLSGVCAGVIVMDGSYWLLLGCFVGGTLSGIFAKAAEHA